jgi:hypothetical protein
MYRGHVDRLRGEIAGLEAKAAEERSKATRERANAQRVATSVTRSTSPSLAESKARDALRHEERANAHDKRAAAHDKSIALKSRQLTATLASLERAVGQERKKDEAASKRRRDDDLRHIRELEARRRSLQAPLTQAAPEVTPTPDHGEPTEFEFDVCLSFAGEDRAYVEMVAAGLKARGLKVFYDDDHKVKSWGKNLAEYFDYIYRTASRYCVMFVSAAYASKRWTRHERRSALARALVEEGEYVLPARFDDTELPGLLPTIAWVDLREIAPDTLVDFIVEKVGHEIGAEDTEVDATTDAADEAPVVDT